MAWIILVFALVMLIVPFVWVFWMMSAPLREQLEAGEEWRWL